MKKRTIENLSLLAATAFAGVVFSYCNHGWSQSVSNHQFPESRRQEFAMACAKQLEKATLQRHDGLATHEVYHNAQQYENSLPTCQHYQWLESKHHSENLYILGWLISGIIGASTGLVALGRPKQSATPQSPRIEPT